MTSWFLIVGMGRVLQAVIGLAAIKVATSWLPPAEMGVFSLIYGVIGYVGLTFSNPIGLYMTRHINEWESEGLASLRFFWFFLYLLLASLLCFLLVFSLSRGFNLFGSQEHSKLAFVVALFFLSQSTVNTFANLMNIIGNQLTFVSVSVCSLGLALLMAWLIVSNGYPNTLHWIAGQALSYIVFVPISFALFFSKNGRISIVKIQEDLLNFKPGIKGVYKYTSPLLLATGLMWLFVEGYRFPIEVIAGLEYLGKFSVGLLVAQRCGVAIETLTTQVFSPVFFKSIVGSDKQHRQKQWNQLFYNTVPIYILSAFFLAGVSPYLGRILVGDTYQDSWTFIFIGVGVQLFRSIGNIFTTVAHSEKDTSSLIIPYAVAAGLCIGGIVLVGQRPEWIYYGVPLSFLLTTILSTVFIAFRMNKILKTHLNFFVLGKYCVLGLPMLTMLLGWKSRLDMKFCILAIFLGGTIYVGLVYVFHLKKINWRQL